MDDGAIFSTRKTLKQTSGIICMDDRYSQYIAEHLVGFLILFWEQCT